MLRGPQAASAYWVLDRKAGKKVLVTPDTRQLYIDSVRYIRLHKEPVPADTQEIIKIVDAQLDVGIAQGDFDEEDVQWAGDGVSSRLYSRNRQQKEIAGRTEPEHSGVPESVGGEGGYVGDSPYEPAIADAEVEVAPEPPAAPPVKKAAKKKVARKKAATKKSE